MESNTDLITAHLRRLAREHPELSIGELLPEVLPDHRTPEALLIFKETLEGLSGDSRSVCTTIFSLPHKVNRRGGKLYLKRRLRAMGWGWSRIWGCFREIRGVLNGNGRNRV